MGKFTASANYLELNRRDFLRVSALGSGAVVFAPSGFLHAYDPNPLNPPDANGIRLANGFSARVVATVAHVAIVGKVLGLNPKTGESLWSCDTDITWYMVPSGIAADGVVYYLGGRSGVAALAVRTGGRGDVTKTHRLWTSIKGSNVTSPVLRDGHLYWMHEKLGIAYCAKAETGELVYEERMNRGGQVYASALLAGDQIYYTNRSGRTFVVSAEPEFQLVSTNELRDGSLFNASPAVSDDKLLVRSDKFLYCLSK